MSHRETKKDGHRKKHEGKDKSAGTPLKKASGNSDRREKEDDSVESMTKKLKGVSLDGKTRSTGKPSTSSRPAGGNTPRTQTAAQPERSLTKAPKFIKVKVSGMFGSTLRSAMLDSYMASSSSQVPPTMQGDAVSRSMKAEMFGENFHLVTKTQIGDNRHAQVLGVLDTGASVISVNRQFMLSHGVTADELNKSLVGNDTYVRMGFQDPLSNVGSVTAPLHQDKFTFGGQSGAITVEKQSFYVIEQAPFPILIGLGPPTSVGLLGHGLEDAPSLLQNVSKQHGLKEIIGIDVSPWRDTGSDWDVLKGSRMDFGGTDETRYDKSTIRYMSSSIQSEYYGNEVKRVTYANPSGKTVDLTRTKEKVIVDSGTACIMLPEDIWKKFKSCLQDHGIKIFDYNNPRLKTIEKRHLAKLRPLSFHLVDVDGRDFSIEIPLAGQAYPPSMGPIMGCHDDNLVPLTVVPSYVDFIVLGIPVFQRRYVILDLTTNPYRIGFAMKEKTDYVNPSLQTILNKYPRFPPIAPKPEQPGESRGGSSRHRK